MRSLCLVVIFSLPLFAQPVPPDNDYVHQQFGDTCSLDPQFKPMIGDLNGDGIEDLAVVARCTNPVIDQDEKNFRVIDPLNSFYGYGDTRITSGFGQADPRLKGISILIVHGSGADAWRATQPQAKFVVINLAVKSVNLKRTRLRHKKSVVAVYVEESGADASTAAIFWDGRKYKYEPMGSGLD